MRSLHDLPDHELDVALEELGDFLAYPPAPDLSRRVVARLQGGRRSAGWRRWAYAAAFVAFVLAASLVASPALRHAVADWLGLPGISIRVDDNGPAPSEDVRLALGRRVTLARARDLADFGVLSPPPGALGRPDRVHFAPDPPGGRVSFVYRAGPGLPEAESSGIGLLLTEFRGDFRRELIGKIVPPDADFRALEVNGGRGYWIGGRPHSFLYIDDRGRVREESVRFADNVLLWEQGGLTLRLESALTLPEALDIARLVKER